MSQDNDIWEPVAVLIGAVLILVFIIVAVLLHKQPCTGYGGHWEQHNCVTRRHLVCKPSIRNVEVGCHFEKRTTCDNVCVGATDE